MDELDDLIATINKIKNAVEVNELFIDEIEQCLQSDDFLLRCDTIEALSIFMDEKNVQEIVISMLNDSNYLVRCEACDALSYTVSMQAQYRLLNAGKKDRSSTVRMHAIASICHSMKKGGLHEDIIEHLKLAYPKEKSQRVLLAYLSIFYLIDKDCKYVLEALRYLNDSDYHIRHNVINLLSDVIDENIIELVCGEYSKRLLIEDAQSVKTLLEQEIERLGGEASL